MAGREFRAEPSLDEEGYWEAQAKQNIPFIDALAELIDNSISASIRDSAYFEKEEPEEAFKIQLTIIREDDLAHFIVADQGLGIPREDLENDVIVSPGNRQAATGILNEHGFGLKNALPVLTKNRSDTPFLILTRHAGSDVLEADEFLVVKGPFNRKGGLAGSVEDSASLWNQGTEYLPAKPDHGTRIHFTTNYDQLRDVYRRASRLGILAQAVREELGVRYRHFLWKTGRNQLWIRWQDNVRNESGEAQVQPIFPVFKEGENVEGEPWRRVDEIWVEDEDGNEHRLEFLRGTVDWNLTRQKYERDEFKGLVTGNEGSPFRIHYRNNQQTQGVDIVYRGRTLRTHLMDEIWNEVGLDGGSYPPHNRFNRFVGEIRIYSGPFETVNNKTGLHEDTDVWKDLKTKLNEQEQFHPIPHGRKEQEEDLKKKLEDHLDGPAVSDLKRENSYWGGVKIDIVQEFEEGYEIIYEVKRGRAEPLDVYQLIMCWDSYVRDEETTLKKAVLVAKKLTPNAEQFLHRWQGRTPDNRDEPYSLEFLQLGEDVPIGED